MKLKKFGCGALVGVLLWAAFTVFAKPYRVAGDCMRPAFQDGQLYFLNRAIPYLRQYRINDVVAFKHEEKIWISRIVALGGNSIQLSENTIIIDGIIQKDQIHRNWSDWKYGSYATSATFQIPKNSIFVLSDNLSAHHDDSRVFGAILKDSVVGLIWKL